MKSHLKALAVVFIIAAITACKPQQYNSTDTANADHSTPIQTAGKPLNTDEQILSEKGHYVVKWQLIERDNIPLNQYFALNVYLSEPLKPANYPLELSINAGMQAHNHGMHTKPVIQRRTNQHFVVEGMLFHMPGTWQIEFTISRGIIRDTARLEVVL